MTHIYAQVGQAAATKVLNREDEFNMKPIQAYGIASVIAACYELEEEAFDTTVWDYIKSAKVNGKQAWNDSIKVEHIAKLGYMTTELMPTDRLVEMFTVEKKKNVPHVGRVNQEGRISTRTDKKGRNDGNKEVIEALEACESTLYTVDTRMLKLATQFGLAQDKYVVDGCWSLIEQGNPAVASEFSTDDRGRMYHKSCHGANGQAGDMQRALMELHGVSTEYDIDAAKKVIYAEMEDMISGNTNVDDQFARIKEMGSQAFLKQCKVVVKREDESGRIIRKLEDDMVKKPWSFIKACFLLNDLMQGKRPYIGMAFGFDAKCSGPQLAAVMLGETKIAQACGWGYTKGKDAYELCIENLEAAGFGNISRGGIKKAYMGVFYGQGVQAFLETDPKCLHPEIIANIGGEINVARKFHKVVSNSFGRKVAAFRSMIKMPR